MGRRCAALLPAILIVATLGRAAGQIRDGAALYAERCADCHGADARGVSGPSLTRLWASGFTDDRVFQTIRAGVAGSIMPPSTAPDAEIRALVAYLKTLGTADAGATTGNVTHGQALFDARCATCHRVSARGGRLGPDLSRIGENRSPDALATAIRNPGAAVAPGFQTVTVVTRDGTRIRGVRKNEDAFSIQILDTSERLRGFLKSELGDLVREEGSLMPVFDAARMSDADLGDLVSYLGTLKRDAAPVGAAASAAAAAASGVTYEHLLAGLSNPERWLTHSGDYSAQRHSPLRQITPENVSTLVPAWTFQTGTLTRGRGFETTPLLFDGVLYVTGSNNFAWALDARTGRPFWQYRRALPDDLTYGARAPVNRGFGILGDRLFMVTLDAHLLAFDRMTGGILWDVVLADYKIGHAATVAPLVVKNKVIVGISGGEYPTRGFLDAYDPATGLRLWRFYTVPAPGEPASATWPDSPDQLARGGGATWTTGSYDPELNLIYWGTGNPNPDYYGDGRQGDNLYTNSIVALDADSGRLKWYYQFTPHDTHDWDANQIPVLAELVGRKVVMLANRNGFFYVLDRITGELLVGKPFTDTTWAREIGSDGRPIVLNDGRTSCVPDQWGGTNFMPPSYDPDLGLFFVTARETCATYAPKDAEIVPGEPSFGGTVRVDPSQGYGALRAIDPASGERRWEFRYTSPSMAGVLSTAAGLVFAGDNEGNFMAFDAKTGRNLWHYPTGSSIWGAAAMTYMLNGRQYVIIPSGATLVAFTLPTDPD